MKSVCSFLILVSSLTWASTNKVGNGGDGIFCKNSAQLLDFYEKDFQFSSTAQDPFAIARSRLEHLKTLAPELSEQYLRRLDEIKNEIDFKTQVSLTDIKDSQHLFEPIAKDCRILQVAIRKAQLLPGEKRFLIQEDLWKKLSPIHEAGLLTHEIIYEHLSQLGEENSIKARQLNRQLYDDKTTKDEFWRFVKNLEIPLYP